MNDLTKTTNGQLALNVENPFLSYGESVKQTSIVGKLLKFSKGDWMAGENNEIIDDGVQFVANMDELLIGWIKWQDMKPVEQIMGKVSKGHQPQRRSDLGDNDREAWDTDDRGEPRDPWQLSNYLLMQGTGEDDAELYTFTASSKGGLNAIGDLCIKYGNAIKRGKGNEFPVVAIGQGQYMHPNKAYGYIKFPTFEIVGWVPKKAFLSVDEAAGSDETETVPEKATAPASAAAKTSGKPKPKARF